jgi:hypothetical protein
MFSNDNAGLKGTTASPARIAVVRIAAVICLIFMSPTPD